MGIDLGSIGAAFGDDGIFGLIDGVLGWAGDLTGGLGFFTGGDFQEAFDGGFML